MAIEPPSDDLDTARTVGPKPDPERPFPSTQKDLVGPSEEERDLEELEPVEEPGQTLFSFSPYEPGTLGVPETVADDALKPGESVAGRLRQDRGIRGDISLEGQGVPGDMVAGPASAGRYAVVEEIARGGMGAIVQILDNDLRRPVAMKVILGDQSREKVERFVEEAQVTGQLAHPNIVPVHELGLDPSGRVYFTMKLVQGQSLEAILRNLAAGDPDTCKAFPLSRLLAVFLKVCDAIAFAHAKGVIHRDLKPENVMVGSFGQVLVMDWGLAKVMGREDTAREEMVATIRSDKEMGKTLAGEVMGTPSYMPPEQADGLMDEIDERSDIFALGSILYAILTKDAPYTGATVFNLLAKAVKGEVVPPRVRAPAADIPSELESICLTAMARKKEARYATVEAFNDDVQAFIDHRLVEAHRYTAWRRFIRFVQRHPAGSLTVAVAVVLLAAGIAVVGVMAARARTREAQKVAALASAETQALRAETAEQERTLADLRAQRAKETLGKGRAVARLLRSANVELWPVSVRLKELLYSPNTTREDLQRASQRHWHRVEQFERTVPDDPASHATWLAVKGWLLRLSGRGEEARAHFKKSRETDPDVAYGALFEAMALFSSYIMLQGFPAYTAGPRVFRFHGLVGERGRQKEIRVRLQACLEEVKKAELWGESSAEDLREALSGFQGLHARKLEQADRGLSMALAIPELIWIREEVHVARSHIRLLRLHFDRAIEDLDMALDVNSRSTLLHFFRAKAYLCKGLYEGSKGKDSRRSLHQAIESYGGVLKVEPDNRGAYHARGLAWSNLSQLLNTHGENPLPAAEEAIRDFTEALNRMPQGYVDYNLAVSHSGRGGVYLFLAYLAARRGEDAAPLYRKGLDDFFEMLHKKVWHRGGPERLRNAIVATCRYQASQGKAPSTYLDGLLSALRDKASQDADVWRPWFDQAHILAFLGRFEEAAKAFDETGTRYLAQRRARKLPYMTQSSQKSLAAWAEDCRKKAALPAWHRGLTRADTAIQLGDYGASLALYAGGLVGARKVGAYEAPKHGKLLAGAHYNVACLYALASAGQSRLAGRKEAVAEAAAQKHRKKALGQLAVALSLGYTNLDHCARDPDLAAIHPLPAFKTLLETWRKKLASGKE